MILYYRESNGDYLAIETATKRHYFGSFGQDYFEGRSTAIAGLISSVCTTAISRGFLRTNCKRVPRAEVPVEWRRAIAENAPLPPSPPQANAPRTGITHPSLSQGSR
jgi:hypothetical protein